MNITQRFKQNVAGTLRPDLIELRAKLDARLKQEKNPMIKGSLRSRILIIDAEIYHRETGKPRESFGNY